MNRKRKLIDKICDNKRYAKVVVNKRSFFLLNRQKKKLESSVNDLPRPDLPTKRRSLNLATWFFMYATEFRSSAQKFSSLPAAMVTLVPSLTSPRATTLKATGRVLLDRQWAGKTEHTKFGLPVPTNSPGWSPRIVLTLPWSAPNTMSTPDIMGSEENGGKPFRSAGKCMWKGQRWLRSLSFKLSSSRSCLYN